MRRSRGAALIVAAGWLAAIAGTGGARGATARDVAGQTALTRACEKGDEAEVKRLLEAGADVNARDRKGRAPLLVAVTACRWQYYDVIMGGIQERYDRVCKLLLDHGAQVDAADESGRTALMQAAGWEHGEIVETLLERGADPNRPDRAGRTALTWAAGHGWDKHPIVLELLSHGARVGLLDALFLGRPAEARALIAGGARLSVRGPIGQTPLHLAAEHGDLATARLLLSRGVDPNARDDAGVTPLFVAIAGRAVHHQIGGVSYSRDQLVDRVRIVRALLAAHAKPDPRLAKEDGPWPEGTTGATPLMRAATVGEPALALALIAGGADVNAADAEGMTPLMYAAANVKLSKGDPDGDWAGVARVLLAAHARVNARDQRRETALIVAAERANLPVAKVLVEHGADVNARDQYGQTAMTAAIYSPEIVRLLLRRGARVVADREGRTALTGAIEWADTALVKEILRRHEPIGLVDAAMLGDLARVRRLLATPAGHAQASHALAACIDRGRADIVEALVAAGASPSQADWYGTCLLARVITAPGFRGPRAEPLLRANRNEARVVRIVRALLRKGAKVDQPSRMSQFEGEPDGADRVTALMLAAARGSVPLVRALLAAGAQVNAQSSTGRTALDYALRNRHAAAAAVLQAAGGQPGPPGARPRGVPEPAVGGAG